MKIYIFLVMIFLETFLMSPASAGSLSCNLGPKIVSPQLELLDREASQLIGKAGERSAIWKLYDAAIRLKSPYYELLAAYYYVHYYRWNHQADSLQIWLHRLDSLSQQGTCNILSIEGRRMLVELYCISGNSNKAWEETKAMDKLLVQPDCSAGNVTVRSTLALVYLAINQEDEAEQILQEVISGPEEERNAYYCQAASLMLARMALGRREPDVAYTYLERVRHALIELKNEETGFGQLRYYDIRMHYYVYFSQYCLQRNNLQDARLTLEKLQEEVLPSGYIGGQILRYCTSACFYTVTGQVEQALSAWDKGIELLGPNSGYSVVLYRRKADLLDKCGRHKEAYENYLTLTQLQDSIGQHLYIQQINQFKAEYQAGQNRIQNEMLSDKSRSLYILIGILLFVALLLIVFIYVNKRLKKVLYSSMQKAERSDRLKSAFLANMNHEIRTPLNAIAGFSQLLVEETDQATSEQYIDIIKGNNGLLMELLNDVLDISRIESDTITFTYSKVYLPQLINELYEVAKLQALWAVNVLKDSTPDLYIYTDRNRLVQILSNLISNAIKHTSEGSISIGYEPCDSDMIRFYVTDTGKGIPEELKNKIFARFVQAVEAHSKGVGLGLALCKGFVEHLGGEIGVESEEGKGSTFWFTLPSRLPDN